MELYWTILAGVILALWTVFTAFRDYKRQTVAYSREIMSRLLVADQISIDHPEIHKYLSTTAEKKEDYFRDDARLDEEIFFRSKSYVYARLNLFDEILSVSARSKSWFFVFQSPQILDIADWKAYIKHSMTHPLYRSILEKEQAIFGLNLQSFWIEHRLAIIDTPTDKFSW